MLSVVYVDSFCNCRLGSWALKSSNPHHILR